MSQTYTRNDAGKNPAVLLQDCRACGVASGKRCVTETGRIAQWCHNKRRTDYLQAHPEA